MIRKRTILVYIVLLAAVLVGILYGAYRFFFGGLSADDSMKNMVDSHTAGSAEPEHTPCSCLALFGIDTADGDDGRSDAILLASVDSETNTIRLCSVARDTRVAIDGHGQGKLNAAYAYGGGALAVQTINENFGTEVTDYIAVNFSGLAQIIDELGGVTVELSDGELAYLDELGNGLQAGRAVQLNGAQAVAYSRIRHLDSDNVRTSRQREVLSSMLDAVRDMDSAQYPALLQQLLTQCTTNLTQVQLLALAAQLTPAETTIKQHAIPSEQTNAQGGLIDGVWYYTYDLTAAGEEIRTFLKI